tara:strand:- start:245 stop:616 length:372 start_codon:yes stop_codon:yes gene_type:complete
MMVKNPLIYLKRNKTKKNIKTKLEHMLGDNLLTCFSSVGRALDCNGFLFDIHRSSVRFRQAGCGVRDADKEPIRGKGTFYLYFFLFFQVMNMVSLFFKQGWWGLKIYYTFKCNNDNHFFGCYY